MMNLFFQKNEHEKVTTYDSQTFLKVSNNLDSHYYILERVKNGDSQYLTSHYYLQNHPHIVSYYTSWKEQELIQEQVPVIKKPKQKKSLIGGLLNKKGKAEGGEMKNKLVKEKQQIIVKSYIEDVLYIQLQSFSEVKIQCNLEDIKQFMALIYLLAARIFQEFKIWPRMIPVITESKKYKFIKKGHSLYHQLVDLFQFCTNTKKQLILTEWSEPLKHQLLQKNKEEREKILGEFFEKQLQHILAKEYLIKIKKGSQFINQTVLISNPFMLIFKQSLTQLNINEYDITYYHQDQDTRQIVMEHNYENTITIQGNKSNLIIKYLKQFVMST